MSQYNNTNARPLGATPSIITHLGNLGEQYGTQAVARWPVGNARRQVLVDITRAECLWRVSVFGDAILKVSWGTGGSFIVDNVICPLVLTVPGSLTIDAIPRDNSTPSSAQATLTKSTGSVSIPSFRQHLTGPAAFVLQVVQVTALTPAVVDVLGTPVAVPVGGTLPIVEGSALTSGTVIAELEA